MFNFYAKAVICIAQLANVDKYATNLSWNVWFRRDWTLQELLVPKTVIFLSTEWNVIGYKHHNLAPHPFHSGQNLGRDLVPEISRITGIDNRVLYGEVSLNRISLRAKLSWTERRTTTLPEHKYYCLQGLFGIYVPPAYGIGQRKAWILFRNAIDSFTSIGRHGPWLQDVPEHFMPESEDSDEESAGDGSEEELEEQWY